MKRGRPVSSRGVRDPAPAGPPGRGLERKRRTMKIGLTQRVETLAEINETRDCLDQSWAAFLFRAGYLPVPLPNQARQADLLVQGLELAGVILTGGNDLAGLPGTRNVAPVRDAFERELLDVCAARRLPVLGVCRGMQMMVCHCGGSVEAVDNHVRRPHPVIPRESVMPVHPRAEVNSFHTFGTRVERLGPDLRPAGLAPDGTVEAVVHRDLPFWAVMWHPERSIRPGGSRDERDAGIIHALFRGQHA